MIMGKDPQGLERVGRQETRHKGRTRSQAGRDWRLAGCTQEGRGGGKEGDSLESQRWKSELSSAVEDRDTVAIKCLLLDQSEPGTPTGRYQISPKQQLLCQGLPWCSSGYSPPKP